MARKTGAESLASAVGYLLRQYGEQVDEALKSDLQYAGEFAVNEVVRLSPKRSGTKGKKTSENEKGRKTSYSKGWDYTFTSRGGELKVTVGNTTKPSLTHLLEKGHMNRDGSWTSARKHIEPAYDAAVEFLERRLHG